MTARVHKRGHMAYPCVVANVSAQQSGPQLAAWTRNGHRSADEVPMASGRMMAVAA